MFSNMFSDTSASTSLNQGENMQIESTTTDGNAANALTIPVPEDNVIQVNAHVVARKSDSSKRAMWSLSGMFYRNAGGVVTQEGDTLLSDERISSGCGYAAILYADTTNNQIHVQVTGTTGETVYWNAQATYFRK